MSGQRAEHDSMEMGIIVCGLNGAGKSTLGEALAEKLGSYFLDSEELYFSKTDSDYPYASPRTHQEAGELLSREVKAHENFVLASTKGDYGEAVYPFFKYAVLINVPKEIRMQRVKKRSFEKFGNRAMPGGDLYEQEEHFFHIADSRAEDTVEQWIKSLSCPVIRVDGTRPIKENVDFIINQIQG